MASPNAVPAKPLPADFTDWLFLVRQAICLQAEFQTLRADFNDGSSRRSQRMPDTRATRRAFLTGIQRGAASGLRAEGGRCPTVTLTHSQQAALFARDAERYRATPASQRLSPESYARHQAIKTEREACIAIGAFARSLASAPCIGDPVFRAGFMARHFHFPATAKENRQ